MSTILNGDQSHSTTPLTAAVSAIANNGSGLWRVTTSTAHYFGPDDYVQLQVTISATPVIVYGFITVIDATHFDVAGTTYTATGAGTATDLSLSPQFQVPTDGDPFSLQLSGMLSAFQCLADRTQALRYMQVSRAMVVVFATATANVKIPPWATYMLVIGCGGGGGAGGGPGGFSGTADQQLSAGGGGAGSRRVVQLLQVVGGATSIDAVVGAGGAGGAGSNGASNPASGSPGSDGGSTTATWHDGSFSGTTFATLLGGAGGGGGLNLSVSTIVATSASIPIFTPGGRGPAGLFRAGPAGLFSQLAPGVRQLQNIVNAGAGALTTPAVWNASIYTDPVGQMDPSEGGASVANGNHTLYAPALSYAGAPSAEGTAGGAAGANGTASSTYPGGAGGGGGGAGGGGNGGGGGAGGAGASSGNGTNGTVGTSASTNSGGGGGGGGGGGNASGTAGNGADGGTGGSGFLELVFLGIPVTP